MDIHPRISVDQISTWTWTLAQDIAFCKKIGAKVIAPPLLKFTDLAADIKAVKDAGLKVCSVSGGRTEVLIDSEEATFQALKPYLDGAAELGAPSCYVVTGPTPPRMSTQEACERFVKFVGKARDYGKEKGVRLAIEHNSVTTRDIGFVHALGDAVEVARAADIGIDLEFQNCWSDKNLKQLLRDNIDLITLVQVSDYLVGENLRMNRRVPGDGSLPLEWMLGCCLDAGYTGYFDIELIGPAIEEEGYEPAMLRALEWLNKRLYDWGVK